MERFDVEALCRSGDLASAPATFAPAARLAGRSDAGAITLGALGRWLRVPEPIGEDVAGVRFAKRNVTRGSVLHRQGEPFQCLYALGEGVFKTVAVDRHGNEQLVSLGFGGEIVGLDGVSGTCLSTTVALTPTWVARLPYAQLVELAAQHRPVRVLLDRVTAGELARHVETTRLLGIVKSPARLAAFLLMLARRECRGLAAGTTIDLAMTRPELGSFLGLRFETVIRGFTALARQGLVRSRKRTVEILDPGGLAHLAEHGVLREPLAPACAGAATASGPSNATRAAMSPAAPSHAASAHERRVRPAAMVSLGDRTTAVRPRTRCPARPG